MAESTKHRHAFERYWRLGPERSIEALHAAMRAEGKAPSLRTLYAWSSKYQWQDRIADLERDARAAEHEARVAVIREMHERHVKEALLLQQRGAEWLATINETKATPDAAIRALVEGAKLERLARGEPTEVKEIHHDDADPRLSRLSDERLAALIARAEDALGGADAARPGG